MRRRQITETRDTKLALVQCTRDVLSHLAFALRGFVVNCTSTHIVDNSLTVRIQKLGTEPKLIPNP